jgi:hypothetical protein
MTNGVTRDAVKKFVLADYSSLEIAFLIDEALHGTTSLVASRGASAEGICADLIDRLLTSLEDYVRTALAAGWEVHRDRRPDFLRNYASLWIRKPDWPRTQSDSWAGIYLQTQSPLWQNLAIGFWAHRADFSDVIRNRVRTTLDHLIPNSSENDWCPAVKYGDALPLPYNWWDSGLMLRIYKELPDRSSPLCQDINQLGDRLVRLANAVPENWWV